MSNNQNFNILKFIRIVLKRWYVILASLAFALALAWLYHRYTVPTYRITASLMVKQGEGTSYADYIFGSKNRNELNLNNETAILRSFGYVATTIASLDFNISYFREGQFVTSELYPDSPISVEVDFQKSENPAMHQMIAVKGGQENAYWLTFPEQEAARCEFDKWYDLNGMYFRITKNYDLPAEDRILFKINTLESLTRDYVNRLRIYPQSATSSVLEITLEGQNRAKEVAFMNSFLTNAEKLNLNEKNYNYRKALNFLDEQLEINTDSLKTFENRILDFQDETNTVSIEAETASLYNEIQALESQKSQILINNKYYDYLIQTLKNGSQIDKITIPASIGVDDPALAELVSRLITSQMEVKSLLEDNKTKNPLVANKQKEINELKTHILSTVQNLRGAKQITLDEINNRLRENRVALSRMPKAQQELGGIERNYGINENLYMLLMNKKLETAIQLAANLPDYKKVNDAVVSGGPVSPRYTQNYLFAAAGGLAVPIAILYVLFLLNNRIASKEELQEVIPHNVLGSIPEAKAKKDFENNLVELDSPIGEAFRTLRTNLGFIRHTQEKGQVVMFTSGISGEGKTFISQHLAYVMAMAGKKIILINCDMRKPYGKEVDEQKGLSEYLAGMATYREIEKDTYMDNLKLINAGQLPPNPAELLLNYRMESLLLDLKQEGYDYIILDSAPIGVFSDALGLIRQVDQMLIVARHNYTPKASLRQLMDVLEGTPKDKIGLIYNGIHSSRRMDAYKRYYNNYDKTKAKRAAAKRKSRKSKKVWSR